MAQVSFSPSECLALLAVFNDACKEVELLTSIGKQNFAAQNETGANRCSQANPDTLLTELNKIFFQTLLRYEKARREDYLELPDGTFRKLVEEESTKVKYLEVASRVAVTLRSLLFELDEASSFTTLERYCRQEQGELDKLATFVSSAAEKEQDLAKLQESIKILQRDVEKESGEFFNTLEHLKHQFQELREMSKMSYQYASKDYAAKLDHRIKAHSEESRVLGNQVDNTKIAVSQTFRVGEETSSWLCADISNKVNLSDFVPKNENPKLLTKRLEVMRKQLEDRKILHAQLKEEYETCDHIVYVDDREKETIRLREEYSRKVVLSVIQIQSWWRTMIASKGIRLRKKRKGKKGGKAKPPAE